MATTMIDRIEISPHCSLTTRGAWIFFASLCITSFSLAGLVALQGYWPVLPFAGLEMALLGWALKLSMQRRHYRQTITVTAESVEIEEYLPERQGRVVFPRHWAQVRMRGGLSPLHPSRLTIESHGRRCEVGSFLNEQERTGLAQRLRLLIGRIDESPPLLPQVSATSLPTNR
ncbi:MAG: DUF2244 domain-containing protein [Sinobacteraceae bacterium]|nr:DUF2244 domain-containing protein [Nevskiaceae bacterium]MCP5340358.1 DUF2244 domain-containing protein [Nevskiaceae bacterium]MCP5466792.1 DUF2244 domain-containing protein [Nevskiaceae bacterium]MCP5470593.1 DUF2244 domain-containing protein [Nevskiaceae bacterium]